MNNSELDKKYRNLQKKFQQMGKVMVAYSGGIDSTLLLKVGTDELRENCIGVLAVSDSLSETENQEARDLASRLNANIMTVQTEELENALYIQNDDKRCFYCKSELFLKLHDLAIERNIKHIVDGNNLDDTADYRPGMDAAKKLKVRSPLIEAGFTKSDIRELSKSLGLPNWDKPAQPCLASRIAYGVSVNSDILRKIDKAETFLKDNGFKIVRVRFLGESVSVEVGIEEINQLFDPKMKTIIVDEFSKIGFASVSFDKDGYSSGKLNTQILEIK